jgi:large subunit ribosomal protein L5e
LHKLVFLIYCRYHPYGGDFEAPEGQKNPFKVVLDVGLRRTTTGARIFGVLKGAVDGGLNIPHSDNRFAGNMDGKYNPEVHRQYIFGMHIGSYMQYRKGDGDGDDEYRAQFSRYIKAKLETAADFEAMYQKVHDTIRKTAVATTEGQRKAKQAAKKAKHAKDTKSAVKKARLSCSQRHARASLKIQKGVPWTHKVAKAPVAAKVAAKGGKAAPKK